MDFANFIGQWICCDCVPCSVQRKKILPPGGCISTTKDVIIYHKMDCFVKGVIIVAPREHAYSISDLTPEVQRELYDSVAEVKKFFVDEGLFDDIVVFKHEGKHACLIILPKIDHEWKESDLDFLDSPAVMKRHGIPVSEPYDMLYLTQLLKNHFKKFQFQMISI